MKLHRSAVRLCLRAVLGMRRHCGGATGVLAAALLPIAACAADSPSGPPRLTPGQAYSALAATGDLRNVQIDGDLDLALVRAPAGRAAVILSAVNLSGRLVNGAEDASPPAAAKPPATSVQIVNSTLAGIDLRAGTLRGELSIEDTRVAGSARFDDARFEASLALHNVTFGSAASFRRARFGASVAITYCVFEVVSGSSGGVSFADARFNGPARFDRSIFKGYVTFDSGRFAEDASFIGLEVTGTASWRNVLFGRDAEFRYCKVGEADFGNAELMSVFTGLADFRGCNAGSLRLDFADLRGDAMFVNVRVARDMTLRQAVMRGSQSDFNGLSVGGQLDLAGAHITAAHWRWADIGPAIERSHPDSSVLGRLQRRLKELDQADEARDVQALLSEQLIRERLNRTDIDLVERGRLHAERVLWGATTRYGTNLGRILLLCLAAWLLMAVPLATWPGLRVGRLVAPSDSAPGRHEAAETDLLRDVASNPRAQLRQRLAFGTGLLFALPGMRWRAVKPISRGLAGWLMAMRGIGLLLLALLALTLTQVSPVFQAIVGKLGLG